MPLRYARSMPAPALNPLPITLSPAVEAVLRGLHAMARRRARLESLTRALASAPDNLARIRIARQILRTSAARQTTPRAGRIEPPRPSTQNRKPKVQHPLRVLNHPPQPPQL